MKKCLRDVSATGEIDMGSDHRALKARLNLDSKTLKNGKVMENNVSTGTKYVGEHSNKKRTKHCNKAQRCNLYRNIASRSREFCWMPRKTARPKSNLNLKWSVKTRILSKHCCERDRVQLVTVRIARDFQSAYRRRCGGENVNNAGTGYQKCWKNSNN